MPLFTLLLAYLLGSVPIGLLLTRWAGLGDIRAIGSGNIGATNVARTGNKKLAALTLLLDALKGAGAVGLAGWLAPEMAWMAALMATLGHMFPVWLKFHGGKGVATSLGAIAAVTPLTALALALTWLAVFALFRTSSLAAISACLMAAPYAYYIENAEVAFLVLVISVLVLFRHKANIARLLRGQELSFKK